MAIKKVPREAVQKCEYRKLDLARFLTNYIYYIRITRQRQQKRRAGIIQHVAINLTETKA